MYVSGRRTCTDEIPSDVSFVGSVQVLDLGVTRLLVHRLEQVFPYLCEGYEPLCGSYVDTYAEANRQLQLLGRLCRATRAGPV